MTLNLPLSYVEICRCNSAIYNFRLTEWSTKFERLSLPLIFVMTKMFNLSQYASNRAVDLITHYYVNTFQKYKV